MGFDIALVVLTYNSDLLKTIATLESARLQRGVRFKVVVADDGSINNNAAQLERYLAESGFDAYEILARDKNVGTVRNLREALDHADAPYVKPISPGDYLYGRDSLATVARAMQQGDLAFCFGHAAYYRQVGDAPEVLNRRGHILGILCAGRRVDARTFKTYQIRHGYSVHGASAAYRARELARCLDVLSANSVRLCEDFSTRLMVMQSLPSAFVDRYLIWYEFGTGVSTNPAGEAYKTMLDDRRKMAALLRRLYPQDPGVRAFQRRVNGPQGLDLASKLRRAVRDPDHALLSLKVRALRRLVRLPDVDLDNYYAIVGAARERLAALDLAHPEAQTEA